MPTRGKQSSRNIKNISFSTAGPAVAESNFLLDDRLLMIHFLPFFSIARVSHESEKTKAPGCISAGQEPFFFGGPYWDRTSDLFDVNEALYR